MSIKGPQTPVTTTAQQEIEQAQLAVDETKEVSIALQAQLADSNSRVQALAQQRQESADRITALLDRADAVDAQRANVTTGRASEALRRRSRELTQQATVEGRQASVIDGQLQQARAENNTLTQEYNRATAAETEAIWRCGIGCGYRRGIDDGKAIRASELRGSFDRRSRAPSISPAGDDAALRIASITQHILADSATQAIRQRTQFQN